MQVSIHPPTQSPVFQTLDHEWYGNAISPALFFRFEYDEAGLHFTARREAPAMVHPEAAEGEFHENLWQYDTAEFFLATEKADRYLEFNLNPAGAWWCRVFCAPRVGDAAMADFHPAVIAHGTCKANAWECTALIPASALAELGIDLQHCRLAATAILNSPGQVFLTTADDLSGEPDFHRPHAWPAPLLA